MELELEPAKKNGAAVVKILVVHGREINLSFLEVWRCIFSIFLVCKENGRVSNHPVSGFRILD